MEEINKLNEKSFFNQSSKLNARKFLLRFYETSRSSHEYFKRFLCSNAGNKRVLEYGCGTGVYSSFLSKNYTTVIGIDISDAAIKLARLQAKKEHLKNVTFLIRDAEETRFKDNTFDVICGVAILHHLDLNKTLKEITRILTPEGKTIFVEPLNHNPFIKLFRKFTPQLRTLGEHPLTKKDITLISNYFYKVDYQFFGLFSLLAALFWNTKLFSPILKLLDSFDRILFKLIPSLKLWAWQVVITFEKPKFK